MEAKGKMYFGTGIDNSGLRQGAAESKNILRSIGDAAVHEGERLDATLQNIGKAAVGVFSVVALKEFVSNVAKVRGEFQQLEIAFSTMLGNKEQADNLMSQLIETAATTPFGMSDIAKASKQLLAYGVQAEDVNETLIRLGDIAAGLSIPIGDLAYLYGTTMVQGRLFTQDLRQFTGRGIPLTEELAKQFGVTKEKVGELVTAGKVGFPEVQQAIINLTSEGSKFGGLMAAQSKTIAGQIANIQDAVEQMFNELGKRSEGVINDTLAVVSKLVDNWEKVGKVLLTVIATYGAYKAAVIAVAVAHKLAGIWGQVSAFLSLTKAITSAKDAMLLLNMATKGNAIGLILGVVAAAASAFALFRKQNDEAAEALARHKEEVKAFEGAVSEAAGRTSASYRLLQAEYKKLKNEHEKREWIKKNKEKFHELGLSVNGVNTAENIFVRNTEAMLTAFKKRAEAAAWQKKLEDAYVERINREQQLEAEAAKIKAGSVSRALSHNAAGGDEYVDREGKWVYTAQGAAKARKALMANDILLNSINANIDKYTAKVQAVGDEYDKAFKSATDDTERELSKEEKEAAARAAKEAQRLADEAAERETRLAERKQARSIAEREAELAIRQAAIDGMKEGFEKQMQENALEYDRLMLANQKREQDMVEALREEKALEWRQDHPKATKEDELKYKMTITAEDLGDTQKAQIQAFADAAADILRYRNQQALDDMLTDVLDYNQQRAKVEEEYNRKRAQLYEGGNPDTGKLRAGVSQGNVDELTRSKDEALKAIDEEFAAREDQYVAWLERIADMSLQQLTETLELAKQELQALEASGAADSKQIAVARAKVAKATEEVNKANAQQDVGIKKRSLKEWEDLYRTLVDCSNEFSEIGDTIGGLAGDAIKAAGSIATSTMSMINGIVQLVSMSSASVQATAVAASKSISTVEKASVILTIISAALSIAMEIARLMNSDDAKQEQIEALQGRIDELQWLLDNADIIRLQTEYGKSVDLLADAYKNYGAAASAALSEVIRTQGDAAAVTEYTRAKTEALKMAVGDLAKAYATVKYSVDKALGEAKYDSAKEQLANLAEQQLLIAEQIDKERSKKDADSEAIRNYEQQIEELGKKAVDVINAMVEEIVGVSAANIASELGDAFFEAFRSGEDYAEAWGDKVNDIVADVTKRMLISRFLEKPLGEIFDKYKDKWYKDGNFVGIDAVIESMSGFAADLNAVGEDFAAIWENLPDSVKNAFTVTGEAQRQASQKGFAAASQDSVDELSGRASAIQGHTYSIAENTKLLVANTSAILESVVLIENHTARLAAVESNIKVVKDTLNDIALKGIRLKN